MKEVKEDRKEMREEGKEKEQRKYMGKEGGEREREKEGEWMREKSG